jgi:hypothetical protein
MDELRCLVPRRHSANLGISKETQNSRWLSFVHIKIVLCDQEILTTILTNFTQPLGIQYGLLNGCIKKNGCSSYPTRCKGVRKAKDFQNEHTVTHVDTFSNHGSAMMPGVIRIAHFSIYGSPTDLHSTKPQTVCSPTSRYYFWHQQKYLQKAPDLRTT